MEKVVALPVKVWSGWGRACERRWIRWPLLSLAVLASVVQAIMPLAW